MIRPPIADHQKNASKSIPQAFCLMMQAEEVNHLEKEVLSNGLVSEEQLANARARAERDNVSLDVILVADGVISPGYRTSLIAEAVGIPFIELRPEQIDTSVCSILPQKLLESSNVLPISLSENWLTIAVEDFTDLDLVSSIERRTGHRVQVIAAEADNIRATRELVFTEVHNEADLSADSSRIDNLLKSIEVPDVSVVEQAPDYDNGDLESLTSESPIVKLVSHIIRDAAQQGASDIHIEPYDKVFRVRYRIDGDLRTAIQPELRLLPPVASRIKLMAGLDISERRLPQDGSMTVTVDERAIDLRVSTMTTRYGEKVVIRVVDRGVGLIGLDELGFQSRMLDTFRSATSQPNGIVLVTGPTGSGKSTTLYAALEELIRDERNICTIEDPVERQLNGANQFQVNSQAGFTFSKALRSLLRQDPDVIMLGEIRDAETARLATEAALTGHLVFSTLHTNDAATAVPRLINMGVEPYMVAASLRAVLAQRLVRQVCPHCRRAKSLTPLQHEVLSIHFPDANAPDTAWTGSGCRRCGGVGTKGRVGIFELVCFDEELLSCITQPDGTLRLRERLSQRGALSLSDDAINKVNDGRIDLDDALRIASSSSLLPSR